MLDDTTLIAYSYKDKNYYNSGLERFNLPVKNWRQMVFVDTDSKSAYFSSQYPSGSIIKEKFCRKLTGGLLSKANNCEPVWQVHSSYNVPTLNEETYSHIKYRPSVTGNYLYSDGCTKAIKLPGGHLKDEVNVGVSEIICLECGYEKHDNNCETLVCRDCYGYVI